VDPRHRCDLNAFVRALAIDGDPQRVVAGTQAGIFRTINGGGTWQPLTNGIGTQRVDALAQAPSDAATFYASAGGAVYRSGDTGEHWQPADGGLPVLAPVQALAVDSSDPLIAYAGHRQPRHLQDDRRRRDLEPASGPAGGQVSSAAITALAVDRQDPQSVWAAGSLGVLLSRTGGNAWTGVNAGLTVRPTTAVAVDPVDGGNVFVGTAGGGVYALRLGAETAATATPTSASNATAAPTTAPSARAAPSTARSASPATALAASIGTCDLAEGVPATAAAVPPTCSSTCRHACDGHERAPTRDQCSDGACPPGRPPLACDACPAMRQRRGCNRRDLHRGRPTPGRHSHPRAQPHRRPRVRRRLRRRRHRRHQRAHRGVGIALGSAMPRYAPSRHQRDGECAINELVGR
jgi:photosystem II stability/assembly factor-like uncharacterized protein